MELHHFFQAFKSVHYAMDYMLVLGEKKKKDKILVIDQQTLVDLFGLMHHNAETGFTKCQVSKGGSNYFK